MKKEKSTKIEKPHGLPGGGQCCREKYWKELSAAEKIERMRRIVKGIDSSCADLCRLVDKLEKHSHHEGNIVIPLERAHRGAMGRMPGQKDPDEVYF